LQSRYYDPEMGRFISADVFTSTGQGLLGNNTFAYSLNNPVIMTDACGAAANIAFSDNVDILSVPTDDPTSGGGGLGLVIAALPSRGSPAIPQTKSNVSKNDSNDRIYTVYFLYDKNESPGTIVYVGRVKTDNFGQRMIYHRKKDRELSFYVPGLTWAECRGLEQVGMIFYHTINRENPAYNQIRGVSPRNGSRGLYLSAAKDYWGMYGMNYSGYMPFGFWANWTENEFLNQTTP